MKRTFLWAGVAQYRFVQDIQVQSRDWLNQIKRGKKEEEDPVAFTIDIMYNY